MRVVGIGASAESIEPLLDVLAALPEDLAAVVHVVMPSPWPGDLVARIRAASNVPVVVEHRAVSTAFQALSIQHRENLIGVVLTGTRDDGMTGLFHVRRTGGITMVQDPAATSDVPVHECLPIDEIANAIVSRVASESGARRARVMIVEDERLIALNIATKLSEAGYDIVGSVASAEDAIAMAERMAPDVVVMDIRLSGEMTGTEAAAALWQRFHLPSVYLSAYTDERTLRQATFAPGGFVVKPFRTTQLHAALQIALARARDLSWESARGLAFPDRR